jgi:hypothetical protein
MKRFLLIPIFFSTLIATAQPSLDITAGVQLSGTTSADLNQTDRLASLFAGVSAGWPVHRSPIVILTQLLYAPMGYDNSQLEGVDQNGNVIGIIDRHRFNYIQLPVYALYTGQAGKVKMNGGIGPYIMFRVGDRLYIRDGDVFGNGSVLPFGVKEMNTVVSGLGLRMAVQVSGFEAAIHFQQSFNGMYKKQAPFPRKWTIGNFGISIGYVFGK